MSAPPYQSDTPAPGALHDPDPTRHLNAPPYPPPDQQPGRPPRQFHAADQDTQQPTVSQNDIHETQGHVQLSGIQRSSAYPNQLHSTYDSSAPRYHAQGEVTNSLKIDPALLAMRQGANEDAQMFDASSYVFSDNITSFSKYECAPTMPAYSLDSLYRKPDHSRGLMLPSPKALAHNTGSNDYVVYTQRDDVHSAAFFDVFSPELMNSGDDHTLGAASAMLESSGDSSSNISPEKKRGRSSSDDGSSNVSMEGFHKPQRPTTQRKRARKSTSSASFSSSESQVSISMSRRESLLAADDSDFKVASGPLQGTSRDRAAEMCIKRVDLNFIGADNVDEVKAERETWTRSIMQAFDDPYNVAPRTKKIDLEEFQQWQKEHHALTTEQFREDPTNTLAEAVATHLYNQVVGSHEKGSLVKSSGSSFRHDGKLKCKERLENIIKALTGFAIIRFDLVTGARVHELVANPDAVFKRKEENKFENDRKKIEKEAAKATNKNKTSAVKAKNGKAETNNKAKGDTKLDGQSESAVVENDEESSSGSDDLSDPEEMPSSARVSASITKPKPAKSVDDVEFSSGPGGEHLAAESEALASSAHGVSTSISASKPVKQVYGDESSSGSDW